MNLIEEPFENNRNKYQDVIRKLGGEDYLDSEEISYVMEFKTKRNVGGE